MSSTDRSSFVCVGILVAAMIFNRTCGDDLIDHHQPDHRVQEFISRMDRLKRRVENDKIATTEGLEITATSGTKVSIRKVLKVWVEVHGLTVLRTDASFSVYR